jgi:hypothetical protein
MWGQCQNSKPYFGAFEKTCRRSACSVGWFVLRRVLLAGCWFDVRKNPEIMVAQLRFPVSKLR